MTTALVTEVQHTVSPPRTARLLPEHPGVDLRSHLDRLGLLPHFAPGELEKIVTEAGLLGRGGGGFPTGQKMSAVAANAAPRRPSVVIANCCEGDPTSSKDAVLIANSAHLVIDGAQLAAAAVGADRIIMAVHKGSRAADDLQRALAERVPETNMVTIVQVPARFVASEATALVRFLNTGDARPAGRSVRIWESGVDGRPTLVDNAETLAQLALIARFGPAWFTSAGTAADPGTTLVTVGGAVSRPGVVEVTGGTPIRTILAAAGWTGSAGPSHRPPWALVGGLAGRWLDLSTTSDIGFTATELAAVGGTKGVSSIVVLHHDGCLLTETTRILQYLADAGARQCGPCMFGLPAIAADMRALAGGESAALGRLHRRLPVIDKRGGCSHPDGAVGLAASALRALTEAESGHLDHHLGFGSCRTSAPVVPLNARSAR